jgi:peptidoglycan/LPS O-acetylase OafA/YrhL
LRPVTYVPGLDGLRAVAVIAVLLFHAEFSVASGGFLGVSLFFTLSGFLITTLLLEEHEATGTLSFRRFYGRRVRRLLPAAYLCLLSVVLVSAWWTAGQQRRLPGDVVAAVANVANWRFAFSSTPYEELFSGEPSPVAHFWSLAIEEQIYLVLPVIVLLALRRGRRGLAATTGVLLCASIVATLLTSDRDLIYNGTHTRAAELLVGVALAQAMHRRPLGPIDSRGRLAWIPGLVAAAAFVVLVGATTLQQSWIYRGGLVGVSMVSVTLIVAVVGGRFPARLLEARPLVAIGKVSYGIYLYHWPVFLLLDEQRTGLEPIALFVLRCLVTAVLTVASYALIEQPIRRGRVVGRDRAMVPSMLVGAAVVALAAVLVVPTPTRTATEELLALGTEDVVEFAAAPVVTDDADETVGSIEDAPTTPLPRAVLPALDDAAPPTTAAPAPSSVAVLGTEPASQALPSTDVEAIAPPERVGTFTVVSDVRPECPVTRRDVPGCGRLVERWSALASATPIDVLVLTTGGVEEADAQQRLGGAAGDAELIALGKDEEAMIDEILATIDAAVDAGTAVVWYSAAPIDGAFFRHFDRIGVERPVVRSVSGTSVDLDEVIRDVVADRGEPAVAADDGVRVLVIGDSTSLNFARALHDGSDGELGVLWAGANGCPFGPVEATRGRSDRDWAESDCEPWHLKVPPLIDSFGPDVLFVMTGPMELVEHRLPGDPTARIAGDPVLAASRSAELEQLLAVLPERLPVLIADLPMITEGAFSGPEMTSPERLAAVNDQILDWDARHAQVTRFAYRDVLEAAEAARPADDQIRSDGTHPDVEPLAELARSTFVPELLAIVERLRLGSAAAGLGG